MEDFERRRYFETLAATPQALKAAIKGLPKKLLLWTPAPGKWSILEILCHLRDMEREGYLERYARILSEDEPRLPDLNGDALAIDARLPEPEGARGRSRLGCASGARRSSSFARPGGPSGRGPGFTRRPAVSRWRTCIRRHAVGNDEAHLGQIDAIKRRFALLERLAAAPAALLAALKGAPDDVLRRKASGGKWSMLENAAHVRDIERVYQGRFQQMAFGEKPVFWMLDNDAAGRGAQVRRGRPWRGREGVPAPAGGHDLAPPRAPARGVEEDRTSPREGRTDGRAARRAPRGPRRGPPREDPRAEGVGLRAGVPPSFARELASLRQHARASGGTPASRPFHENLS